MAAPKWEQYMVPSLQVLDDGEVHRARAINDAAADLLGLTDEDRAALITSGQPRYRNRAMWALSYLSRAGAVERPARGQYRINDLGRRLLSEHRGGLTERDLRALPGYVSPQVKASTVTQAGSEAVVEEDETALDPVEQIETGIARIHAEVASELLSRLHAQDPAFFEPAVLDLLMKMGYGGAEGTATRTQLSNDGGIDGIIDQDALGLARIYVQAKRYALDASIGRPEIQAFVGALHGNQANQGVFITTARFSSGARQYADSVATRVVLIDGERMARLMIRYGVGVQVRRTVEVVEVDEDFFE
jgi:restriction system protein